MIPIGTMSVVKWLGIHRDCMKHQHITNGHPFKYRFIFCCDHNQIYMLGEVVKFTIFPREK